jgi:hypothetical protein
VQRDYARVIKYAPRQARVEALCCSNGQKKEKMVKDKEIGFQA